MGKPLTPSPVTVKSFPAGGGCFDLNSFEAEVTYKMSKFGPPNAADVICSAGNLISSSMAPVVGLILRIFDPPKVATYSEPLVSIVMPSGTNSGRSPLIVKSITTRSLAVNMQAYRYGLMQIDMYSLHMRRKKCKHGWRNAFDSFFLLIYCRIIHLMSQ